MTDLSFTEKELALYYEKKFKPDLLHYFVTSEETFASGFNLPVINNVYERGEGVLDSSPAIYMGCGPWWNEKQNFYFSGIFAYLYLLGKCTFKYLGEETYHKFCAANQIPVIRDFQSDIDYDVVATLKEAGIAPCKGEAANYTMMLAVVIPYMDEMTKLADYCDELRNEMSFRLKELKTWAENTQDEIVSFRGLPLRIELCSYSIYDKKYIQLIPWTEISKRYGINSFNELFEGKTLPLHAEEWREIDTIDSPVTVNHEDLEFIWKYDEKWKLEDDFREESPEEEKERELYNTLIGQIGEDERFYKNGKVGLRDCWGRIIIPAEFENCMGVLETRILSLPNLIAAVQRSGKWAFVRRNNHHEIVTDFVFDEVERYFSGLFIVRKGDKYGVLSWTGKEMIPARMDDIYTPSLLEGHILYKEKGKYGIRYNVPGGIHTPLLDEVDLESKGYLVVTVNGERGYLDERGNFTKDRGQAYLENYGFELKSMVIY